MIHPTHVFHKASPTKDYGHVILGLVAMGWNTSFTILLEHLPSQLEIAGYYKVPLLHVKILKLI
jgi:hypothetical protein